MKTELQKCWRCNGSGSLSWASHYANGVCFQCEGTGSVLVNLEVEQAKQSADTIKKAEWVLSATAENFAPLSYGKLLKIRNFCHCGFGLQQAFPGLLQHWKEHGEEAFQMRQKERLAEYYQQK